MRPRNRSIRERARLTRFHQKGCHRHRWVPLSPAAALYTIRSVLRRRDVRPESCSSFRKRSIVESFVKYYRRYAGTRVLPLLPVGRRQGEARLLDDDGEKSYCWSL